MINKLQGTVIGQDYDTGKLLFTLTGDQIKLNEVIEEVNKLKM